MEINISCVDLGPILPKNVGKDLSGFHFDDVSCLILTIIMVHHYTWWQYVNENRIQLLVVMRLCSGVVGVRSFMILIEMF